MKIQFLAPSFLSVGRGFANAAKNAPGIHTRHTDKLKNKLGNKLLRSAPKDFEGVRIAHTLSYRNDGVLLRSVGRNGNPDVVPRDSKADRESGRRPLEVNSINGEPVVMRQPTQVDLTEYHLKVVEGSDSLHESTAQNIIGDILKFLRRR